MNIRGIPWSRVRRRPARLPQRRSTTGDSARRRHGEHRQYRVRIPEHTEPVLPRFPRFFCPAFSLSLENDFRYVDHSLAPVSAINFPGEYQPRDCTTPYAFSAGTRICSKKDTVETVLLCFARRYPINGESTVEMFSSILARQIVASDYRQRHGPLQEH